MECPVCRRALGPILYAAVPDYEQGVDAAADFAECPACGTLAQVPPRSAAELRRFYPPGYRAHASGYSLIKDLQARALLALIGPSLPPVEKDPKILELGCGGGHLLAALSRKGYRRLLGVDSRESLAQNFANTGIRFVAGDVEDGLRLEGRFDAILLIFSVEHFAEPKKVLAWCRTLLAPGGKVFVLTPDARCFARRVFSRYWSGLHSPRHPHVFTAESLSLLAKGAGFTSVESIPAADPGSWAVSFQNWARTPGTGSLAWYSVALLPIWFAAAALEKWLGSASAALAVLSLK